MKGELDINILRITDEAYFSYIHFPLRISLKILENKLAKLYMSKTVQSYKYEVRKIIWRRRSRLQESSEYEGNFREFLKQIILR